MTHRSRKSATASSKGLGLIAPNHYRNFETVITRNATEYSVRMFEDGKEIAYVDLDAHPIKDWAIVVETICLMHHIPLTRPHKAGRKHRRPEEEVVRDEGGKKVYDLTASEDA